MNTFGVVRQSPEIWEHCLADEITVDAHCLPVSHSDTLVCTTPANGRVSLQLETRSAQRCKTQLRMVVGATCAGRVSIEVNGEQVGIVSLAPEPAASPEYRFHSAKFDVTRLSEPSPEFTVRLRFELQDPAGRAQVLIANDAQGAGSIVQCTRDPRHTALVTVLHCSIWSSIILLMALWYFLRQTHSVLEGAIPTIGGALFWIIPRLIPSEKVKSFSPYRIARKLSAKLGPAARLAFCIFFCGVTTFGVWVDFYAIKGIVVKNRYIELINRAIDPQSKNFTSVAEAFVYLPWRRESFLAYEYQSYLLKADVDQWRAQVAKFIADPRLLDRALAYKPQDIEWYLSDPDARDTINQDPVIAIAHILPEGESDGQWKLKQKAVDLLAGKGKGDVRADLLRFYIEYDVVGMARQSTTASVEKLRSLDDVATDLERAVKKYRENGPHRKPHEYLAALDRLGFHFATKGCDESNVRASISYYAQMLEERQRGLAESDRIWGRSPGKFTLYQIGRYFRYNGNAAQDPVWGRYFENYRKIFNNCALLSQELQKLIQNNAAVVTEKAWQKNSGYTPDLPNFITTEVKLGWRF